MLFPILGALFEGIIWPAIATAIILAVSLLVLAKIMPLRQAESTAPVTSCRVTRLFVHPVKSLGGYEVQSAEVLPRGLRYDREWVVVRARDTKVMTIREIPAMRRVKAEVEGGALVFTNRPLQGPQETIRLPISKDARSDERSEIEMEIWGMPGTVKNEGEQVAAFLTKALNEGKPAQEQYFLGRMVQPRDPKLSEDVEQDNANILDDNLRIRGQDGCSIHILTEESLLWVQKQLANPSLCAELFRPNIVVEGVPFPEEDCWDTMTLKGEGDQKSAVITLKTVKNCDRCAVPTINLDGRRDKDFQPVKFLRSQHAIAPPTKGKPNVGLLGLDVNVRLPPNTALTDDETILGVISVGDELVVASRKDPPQYLL